MKIGLKEMDEFFGDFKKGKVYYLVGRPAIGKTSFCLDIIRKNIADSEMILYLGLDIYSEHTIERLISCISGVRERENLSLGDSILLKSAREDIFKSNHIIISGKDLDLTRIEEAIKLAKPNLVFIDEIEVLVFPKDRLSLIKKIKEIAVRENCPIVIVSKLSRALENREDKRPRLRDVGKVIKTVDAVIMLYRGDYYTYGSKLSGIAEALIYDREKKESKKVELVFLWEYGRYYDVQKNVHTRLV